MRLQLAWQQRVGAFWRALSARERRLVGATSLLVLLGLIWFVALAPAMGTLRAAPAQLDRLDLKLWDVTRMAREARAIQSRPPMTRAQSIQTLEASVRQRLGDGTQLRVVGSRVTITLAGSAPDVLSQWLAQVRVNTRGVPVEVHLKRGPNGWDGTLLLDLPPET